MLPSLLESLTGVWHCGTVNDVDGLLLVITPAHRVLQFVLAAEKPRGSDIMRLWGSDEKQNYLRFRPRPDAEGWLRRVDDRTDDGFTLVAEGRDQEFSFCFRRMEEDARPAWFAEAMAEHLARMDKMERSSASEAPR